MHDHVPLTADELAGKAWAAMARHDAEAALDLWRLMRQEFPDRGDGHIRPVQVLVEAGRLDEAETMASAAAERLSDPEVFAQRAWIAMVRQRWDDALDDWSALRAHAPERSDGYIWAARALWQSGRLDAAAAMAADAADRFPDDPNALAELAWIAVARSDWAEALRWWTLLRSAHAGRIDAIAGSGQALRMMGRPAEAEAMIAEALVRHPDAESLLVEAVWTAVAVDDWTQAAARLETVRHAMNETSRFEVHLGWVDARLRERRGAMASTATIGRPPGRDPHPGSAPVPGAADLMLAFESLGERCDFGAVQRQFGADPLGLLRFAYSKLDALIAALEDRFAAIGTFEDTGFERYDEEIIIRMRKYGLIFHTFVQHTQLTTAEQLAAFHDQQRRRLRFLRNNLIADLESPRKIYVYSTDERTSDMDVARLFAALRAYGRNSLLYVRPSDACHPVGMVEQLVDGLFTGYFSGLTDFVSGAQPPFELWHQLCEQTCLLARGTDPGLCNG